MDQNGDFLEQLFVVREGGPPGGLGHLLGGFDLVIEARGQLQLIGRIVEGVLLAPPFCDLGVDLGAQAYLGLTLAR
jgi:hypothetical protein